MKSQNYKMLCFLLSCVLVIALLPASVFAAAKGPAASYELMRSSELEITDQLILNSARYYRPDGSYMSENYFTYVFVPGKPAETFPSVLYGNDIHGAAAFQTAVGIEETAQPRNVVGGVNGDFFTMSTGIALGAIVKDGVLRTSESSEYECVGFDVYGRSRIGRPGYRIGLINVDSRLPGGGAPMDLLLNKALTSMNGECLFTSDFGADNGATMPTYNVVLNISKDQLKLGVPIYSTVAAIFETSGAVTLSDDKVLVSMASSTPYTVALNNLKALQVGDEIELSITSAGGWEDCVTVIGCERRLVSKGAIVSYSDTARAPRTAIGIKSDKDVIIYTVDGRDSNWSTGMSYEELSQRLIELGCVEAVNLDGGSSTQIYAQLPGYSDTELMSRPASTPVRSCADYLVFERVRDISGDAAKLFVYPYGKVVLGGTSVELSTLATDANYQAAKVPGTVSYSVSGDVGSVSGSTFTAAKGVDATGSISAQTGSLKGSTAITVVSSPDTLTVKDAAGNILGGDQGFVPGKAVQLYAEAMYKRLPIEASDESFTWTLEGSVGTLDQKGLFTPSGESGATGLITVSCGKTSASFNVKIVTEGIALYTFEQYSYNASGPALTAEPNSDLNYVHNGLRSEKLTYDLNAGETAEAALGYSFAGGKYPTMVSMWVYGNGSGNSLWLKTLSGSNAADVELGKLDFTGWKLLSANLPDKTDRISGLQIAQGGSLETKGTVYIDQIVAGYGTYIDTKAPVISAEIASGVLNGSVLDDLDKDLRSSDISVSLDGTAIPFDFNAGSISAPLSLETGHHHIIITATDESGNISRRSIGYSSGEEEIEHPFTDMPLNNWATKYVEYLGSKGVINGKTRDGKTVYDPSANMSRQEFAAVIIRWLGTDVTQYESTELGFSDADQISGWALPSVKAVKAMGLMSGKGEGFDPKGYITRQEAMTVIGRIQEKGYGEDDLSSFTDASDVSAWALPYVKTLVFQGIIGGSNGKLNPKGYITRAQVAKVIFELY